MANGFDALTYPELVFGIAGAIGVDIEGINQALSEVLSTVGYKTVPIHITREIEGQTSNIAVPVNRDFGSTVAYKMSHASDICRMHEAEDTLMRFAMKAIEREREKLIFPEGRPSHRDAAENDVRPCPKTAYVIRQLKRPQEVKLLRKVYGRQFILLSAYASAEDRKRVIEENLKRTLPVTTPASDISSIADKLIYRDQDEGNQKHGQRLRDTFHMADVFFDGTSKPEMVTTLNRFIKALFGKADITPTKAEYGMYAAKSASLRSADLSRQVGAAIFSKDGELITQGCNEVPKAFGGTYWEDDVLDYRDIKLGNDPNEVIKREVVRDLLERLSTAGMLSEKAEQIGGAAEIVEALVKPRAKDNPAGYGSLTDAAVMELTEYGRVVHAEMSAICDAARLGRTVKSAILFCTTFPCHNCTKHLLAAGISTVIYMEPYPKSKAKELNRNEIEIESTSENRVSFLPFLGISPVRYRDIFEKGKRKRDGAALDWMAGTPAPMIDVPAPAYIDLEAFEIRRLDADLSKRADLA